MSSIGSTSSSSWEEHLRLSVLCGFKGPFHPLSGLKHATIADRLEPYFDEGRDSLTFQECDKILNDDSPPKTNANLQKWVKNNLPDEPKYKEIRAEDEEILLFFENALLNRILLSIDHILSFRQSAGTFRQTLKAISDISPQLEKELQTSRDLIDNTIISSAPNVDKDGFLLAASPQAILQREIKLLKEWRDNPSLVLTADFVAQIFETTHDN